MMIQKTPAEGAYCSLIAATAPSLDGVGGLYLVNGKAYKPGKAALDTAAAERLWKISEELTGLKRQ